MFSRFFRPASAARVPHELYGSVVAQARLPVHFIEHGFPDTVTGRFDVLALHVYLLSRRLVRAQDDVAASLNQEVFDAFVADLDRALRQLGIGDLSVPKRKKKLVRGYYAAIAAFDPALDAEDADELARIAETRYGLNGASQGGHEGQGDASARHFADYLLETARHLDRQEMDRILDGHLDWPGLTGLGGGQAG